MQSQFYPATASGLLAAWVWRGSCWHSSGAVPIPIHCIRQWPPDRDVHRLGEWLSSAELRAVLNALSVDVVS